MSAEEPEDRLTRRLARMAPAEPPRRRRRISPYALSGVTAIAGMGVGAWLVLAAPDAPAPAPALETASVSGFQEDATGPEGFAPVAKTPRPGIASPDPDAPAPLEDEVAALKAEIAELKANPSPPAEAAGLEALKAEVEALAAEAKTREVALADLQGENARLQSEIDASAIAETDAAQEAARLREEDLARRRQETEALQEAQIHSDMVALRAGGEISGGTSGEMGWEGGASVADGSGPASGGSAGDAFRRAGAEAAEVREVEVIANPAFTLMQGTLIEAALETAIATDLPGNVAAVVSHDVWSFDMSRVLIPRGSRLFGRYDSEIALGQRRVLIAWDRIVTTDGQSVELAAFGSDRIGRSGLPGTVRRHFLQRFGSAALISVIGAIPAVAASKYQDDAVVSDTVENLGTDLGGAVTDVMADYLTIPPTISVDQGAVVMVRVDADLEFH